MVTHQLQVERRTGKVRRPETDVLPLTPDRNINPATHTMRAASITGLLVHNKRRYRPITWVLGSRVVSVMDSGAEGLGFKSQSTTLSGNSLRQTVHTHRVHQAAKLVAALLRVAGVTAGHAESNGSLPPGL